MLFQFIDKLCDIAIDTINYGPFEAARINTSFCPEAERVSLRINKELQENLEGISSETAPEINNIRESADRKLKAFENLVDDLKLLFDVNAGQLDLGLIYDYYKLNDYGKLIMEKVCPEICQGSSRDSWEKSKAVAMFKKKCIQGEYDKCSFIFWALMVLTVDGADKEKKLSLICDFSMYLNVSDEEMQNIVKLIQAIYS